MATILQPITEQERALRQDALRDALASLRLEGLELDEEARRVFQRHVEGEITFDEFRDAIDQLDERRFGPISLPRNERS